MSNISLNQAHPRRVRSAYQPLLAPGSLFTSFFHRVLSLSNTFAASLIIPHEYSSFIELRWARCNLECECGCVCPRFNSWDAMGGLLRRAGMFRAKNFRGLNFQGNAATAREKEVFSSSPLYSNNVCLTNLETVNTGIFRFRQLCNLSAQLSHLFSRLLFSCFMMTCLHCTP